MWKSHEDISDRVFGSSPEMTPVERESQYTPGESQYIQGDQRNKALHVQ